MTLSPVVALGYVHTGSTSPSHAGCTAGAGSLIDTT